MVTYVYTVSLLCGAPDRGAAEAAGAHPNTGTILPEGRWSVSVPTSAAGRVMPSPRYYREQARVFLELASLEEFNSQQMRKA
jgi:hypothetical protein